MPAPVLHSEVARVLGEEIVGGVLPAGHVLSLAGIEKRFSLSRTVVREAVRVLESLGLVVSKRRVGVTVQPSSAWSVLSPQVIAWRLASDAREEQLRSLTQLRRAVEPAAARAAALRVAEHPGGAGDEGPPAVAPDSADSADAAPSADGAGTGSRPVDALLAAAERLHELGLRGEGTGEEYIEADVAFHGLLLRASGNEMFAALESTIAEVLRGRARLGRNPEWPTRRALDLHLELARAIEEGRAEEAEAAARAIAGDVLREIGGE
ncbi:FadR/GntR family transcriptional regulator [Brachybacterium conglomeratum]|uniref:FadR/GntR family transcriptional regulator n=1 Tax=Brachybacterium conglomeratum TaxID=47846 RepID=UPI003DA029C4